MKTDRIIDDGSDDVTVVVSRTVDPGNERKYDRWVRRLVAAATEADGNTGVTMLIPEPGKPGLYHVVFRFTDQAAVDKWENSEMRRKLTDEADTFSDSYRQVSTGLETWFNIPDCPHLAAPPHWKMFLITTMAGFRFCFEALLIVLYERAVRFRLLFHVVLTLLSYVPVFWIQCQYMAGFPGGSIRNYHEYERFFGAEIRARLQLRSLLDGDSEKRG